MKNEKKQKEAKTQEPEKLMLDDHTREMVQSLLNQKAEVEQKMRIIMQVYLNALGKKGSYMLSGDGTYLISRPQTEPTK